MGQADHKSGKQPTTHLINKKERLGVVLVRRQLMGWRVWMKSYLDCLSEEQLCPCKHLSCSDFESEWKTLIVAKGEMKKQRKKRCQGDSFIA